MSKVTPFYCTYHSFQITENNIAHHNCNKNCKYRIYFPEGMKRRKNKITATA